MHSDTGNTTSLVLGFPIRTSSDQRSVDSSPRLIAASYVLHRPLMPRHPPCALKHLQHKNHTRVLTHAHAQHNRRNYTTTTHTRPTRTRHEPPPPPPERGTTRGDPTSPHDCCESMLATTIHESNTTPHHQNLGQQHASHHTQWPGNHGPVVSKPNSVPGDPPTPTPRINEGRAPAFLSSSP